MIEKNIKISKISQKLYNFDYTYLSKKVNLIAGVDEVGRGSLAGPVMACALILNYEKKINFINDSKKLSSLKRKELFGKIIKSSVSYFVAEVSNEKIDQINIFNATKLAMLKALKNLKVKPQLILVDGMNLDFDNSSSIIKGDEKSACISCASIVAKVSRDNLMLKYDNIYSKYNFKSNKGYPTKEHLKNLLQWGISPIHRLSYSPVKRLLSS